MSRDRKCYTTVHLPLRSTPPCKSPLTVGLITREMDGGGKIDEKSTPISSHRWIKGGREGGREVRNTREKGYGGREGNCSTRMGGRQM